MVGKNLLLGGFLLCSSFVVTAAEKPVYSCQSATKLGYSMTWTGAENGTAVSERGGRYWAFIGESIRFFMKTRFRKDVGEFWVAHSHTDINYAPNNVYRLELTTKKQGDHGEFRLDSPWFKGKTLESSGFFEFTTRELSPTDEPCIEGRGEVVFEDDKQQRVTVNVEFALDISGRKYRQ